jgi:Coenzyme PQQ synthesis protein D (PqqD)
MSELNFRMSGEGHQTRSEEIAPCVAEPGQQFFMRARSVVSRVVGGETLIVPVRGKVGDLASIYSFKGTGSLIWQLLDEPRALSELVSAVEREYGVGHEQTQRDVTQFLDDTLSKGLVQTYQRVAVTGIEATATESKRQVLWETAGSY